jgi:hypothetical protein
MTEKVLLTKSNVSVDFISTRNNVVITITNVPELGTVKGVAINKKYFNEIHKFGEVDGRIRLTPDGLFIFEGYSFK